MVNEKEKINKANEKIDKMKKHCRTVKEGEKGRILKRTR